MKFREFKSNVKKHSTFNIPYQHDLIEKVTQMESSVHEKPHYAPNFKRIILSFSSFVIVLLAFFGFMGYQRVVEVISLDINPSVDIELNRYGKVVNISPQNADAIMLVDHLDVSRGKLEKVLLDIYDKSIELGFSSEDESFILMGILGKSFESEIALAAVIDQFYLTLPVSLLTMNKHSEVEYIYFSGFVDASKESSADFNDIFAEGGMMTTTTMAGTDDSESPVDDFYSNQISSFSSMSSSEFTHLAEDLEISEAKLQLVLSIFFYYPLYQVPSGISSLSVLPLYQLFGLYNSIPQN